MIKILFSQQEHKVEERYQDALLVPVYLPLYPQVVGGGDPCEEEDSPTYS